MILNWTRNPECENKINMKREKAGSVQWTLSMTFRGCQGPFPASSFTPHWPLALSLPIAFLCPSTPSLLLSTFSHCLPITIASLIYALPRRRLRSITIVIQPIQSKPRAPNPAYPWRIYPTPSVPLKILQSSSTTMNPDDDHDRSSSTPNGTSKQGSAQDKDKPRLTDQEKKSNHIASEQKRRAAIREGFDRLTELVPGLEGQGRSESIVLQKTVDFIHVKLQERHDLIAEIESKGGRVDDSFRPT